MTSTWIPLSAGHFLKALSYNRGPSRALIYDGQSSWWSDPQLVAEWVLRPWGGTTVQEDQGQVTGSGVAVRQVSAQPQTPSSASHTTVPQQSRVFVQDGRWGA